LSLLAIELLAACQALEFFRANGDTTTEPLEAVFNVVRKYIDYKTLFSHHDRPSSAEHQKIAVDVRIYAESLTFREIQLSCHHSECSQSV